MSDRFEEDMGEEIRELNAEIARLKREAIMLHDEAEEYYRKALAYDRLRDALKQARLQLTWTGDQWEHNAARAVKTIDAALETPDK